MKKASLGYTVAEVVVAVLISCIMSAAVFSVLIASKVNSKHDDLVFQINQLCNQLNVMLAQYVTGCGCTADGDCSACDPSFPGPNTTQTGAASWSISDSDSNKLQDDWGTGYALGEGNHALTQYSATLEAAPYNMQLSYDVLYPRATNTPSPNPKLNCSSFPTITENCVPQITFNVIWEEPNY